MADNEPTISMAGINAPPLYRLVEDGDKTVIVTADTNTPMWVINGKIGGDTVETMTTAERTAITPEAGQLIFDTTLGILFVGDGSTRGGTAVGGGGGGGVVPGYRLSDDGTSLNFNPVQAIVSVTGSSVTLAPDTAYKMYATTGAVTINANPPASGYWGLESHIELFVGSTGYVVTGSNVVLANALEPDAVNNCTVRFHDGIAIISVEDHVAGYIVVNGSTAGSGSLYYGITTSTNDYVAFDASLNGTTIPLAGAVAEGEKHLVGNGYTETTLTGAVDCSTNKVTVANLALSDVLVTGGTMTLGDAYIPSGSTVAVSGGGLAVEKVTGNGGVIDLGGTKVVVSKTNVGISGCSIEGGIANVNGGAFAFVSTPHVEITSSIISGNSCALTTGGDGGGFLVTSATAVVSLSGSTVTGNRSITGQGGGVAVTNGAVLSATSSVISGNYIGNASSSNDIYVNGATAKILGACEVGKCYLTKGGGIEFSGSNTVKEIVSTSPTYPGTVTLTSGAILDLTGNTNATPIAPGGGITFEQGGATVLYSSGAVSGSYMMDNVTLPAGAKLTNTAVVDLSGAGGTDAKCYGSASGVTILSGNLQVLSDALTNDVVMSKGAMVCSTGATMNNTLVFSGAVIYNAGIVNGGAVYYKGWLNVISGGTANEPIISSGGTLTVASGGTALLVTSNTGATINVSEGGYITYKE